MFLFVSYGTYHFESRARLLGVNFSDELAVFVDHAPQMRHAISHIHVWVGTDQSEQLEQNIRIEVLTSMPFKPNAFRTLSHRNGAWCRVYIVCGALTRLT